MRQPFLWLCTTRLFLVFFLFFGIELGEAAQVAFENVDFGIGCLPAGAFHHHAAEDCQDEDDEGEVERSGPLFVENKVDDGGTNNENIRYDFVDSEVSLIVHSYNITTLSSTIC